MVEDIYLVFSGSVGQIIGPKGAKIKEIKEATAVVSIDTPAKAEDGSRPRARDQVPLTLKGTQHNIDMAKNMIQTVVDGWVSLIIKAFHGSILIFHRQMHLVLLDKATTTMAIRNRV